MSELRVDEDRLPPSLGRLTMALNGGMTPLDYSNTTHHGHQGQSDQSGKIPNWSGCTIQNWMAGSRHKLWYSHFPAMVIIFAFIQGCKKDKFLTKIKTISHTWPATPLCIWSDEFHTWIWGRWPLMKVSWEQQSVEHHSERWPWHQSFALIYGGGGDDIARHSCSSDAR